MHQLLGGNNCMIKSLIIIRKNYIYNAVQIKDAIRLKRPTLVFKKKWVIYQYVTTRS